MTTSTAPRPFGLLSGASYAVLFLASMFVPGLLAASPEAPIPYSTDAEVERYLAAGGVPGVLTPFFHVLAAISLLVFVPLFTAAVRRHGENPWTGVIQGAGTVGAAFLLLSAGAQWVLSRPSTVADLRVFRMVMDLGFITGGPAHVATLGIFVGVGSFLALRTRILPGWLGWLGVAIGALSVLSVFSWLFFGGTFFVPLGRFIGFIWFVAVALRLGLRRT
ncbi:hypothetical protein [Rhizohabitans arisaemae]|uniref:hypothetical protein n=1 Tax=Rhizohabitans arisaemae TaxID=2720610 RepID=UPI0024B08254|nr:hypothetical protein [Rhizohabitans arisaemae]